MSARRGFAQIIIVAVIALVFGAAAIFGYQKYISRNDELIPDKVPPLLNETVYTDEGSANWKTYTDQNLGFSLKYPQDILEPHTGPQWTEKGVILSFFGSDSKLVIIYIGPSTMQKKNVFDFFRNAKDGMVMLPQNTVDDLNNVYGDKKPNKTNLTISGLPAVKLTTNTPAPGLDALASYDTHVYIDKNGSLWEISSHFTEASYRADFMKTFDQILSTFQFTN